MVLASKLRIHLALMPCLQAIGNAEWPQHYRRGRVKCTKPALSPGLLIYKELNMRMMWDVRLLAKIAAIAGVIVLVETVLLSLML